MSLKKIIKDLKLGLNITRSRSTTSNQDNIIPEVINEKVNIKQEVSMPWATRKNNLLEEYQDWGELVYEADLRTIVKKHQTGYRYAYPEEFIHIKTESEFADDVDNIKNKYGMDVPKTSTVSLVNRRIEFERWWENLILVLVNEFQTYELTTEGHLRQKKYESVYMDDEPTYEPIEENEEERVKRFYDEP